MDPEQCLRELAAEHLAPMRRAPRKMHSEFHRATFTRLHGALDVLVKLGLIESRRGFELIDDLLSDTTRELVERGELEEVRVSMSATATATAARTGRRRSLLAALDALMDEGILNESEYRDLRTRVERLTDDEV